MIQSAVEQIVAAMQGAKGLPALESSVSSILDIINETRSNNDNLASRVVEDVALTQKVLKLANSPMYAPFARPASSVSTALDVLGDDALLHIVLSTAMLADDDLDDDPALAKSLLAAELSRNACPDRVESAAVATMMFDLGRLLTEKYLPTEFARIRQMIIAGADADAAATEVLGMTNRQIGVEMAAHWKLPADILALIEGSGDPALIALAHFSSTAATLIQEGQPEAARQLVATLDIPGVDKTNLVGWVSRKAEIVAMRKVRRPDGRPEYALEQLHTRLAAGRPNGIGELAQTMLPELCNALGGAHCLLFMVTKSGDYCIRYGCGKGVDELRPKLRVSGEFRPTPFHAAIKNNVDVSIEEVAKLKPNALPEGYRNLLPRTTQFLILPIAHSRVFGLIYCDWEVRHELTHPVMVALKRLRDLFLPLLPH